MQIKARSLFPSIPRNFPCLVWFVFKVDPGDGRTKVGPIPSITPPRTISIAGNLIRCHPCNKGPRYIRVSVRVVRRISVQEVRCMYPKDGRSVCTWYVYLCVLSMCVQGACICEQGMCVQGLCICVRRVCVYMVCVCTSVCVQGACACAQGICVQVCVPACVQGMCVQGLCINVCAYGLCVRGLCICTTGRGVRWVPKTTR